MKGRLQKNIKTAIFIAPDRIFIPFGLVILLNLKVKVFLNLEIPSLKRDFIWYQQVFFLTFVYLELLNQMNGQSLYVEKLI